MDLLLMGQVTADYLLTGLVAAGIIAPISLSLLSQVLRELSRQDKFARRQCGGRPWATQGCAEFTDEGILMVAPDGRILATNERFAELWRVPPARWPDRVTTTPCSTTSWNN